MTLLKIARLGEPILRRIAAEVPVEEIRSPSIQRLVDDMIETMRDAQGAGLAAPQVYVSTRLCVLEVTSNPRYPGLLPIPLTVVINPNIELLDFSAQGADYVSMYEGCLSVPDLRGQVKRPRKLRLSYLDRQGDPRAQVFEGPSAAVVQHELDHLDGVLFVDRADSQTLTFLREYEKFVPPSDRVHDSGARLS